MGIRWTGKVENVAECAVPEGTLGIISDLFPALTCGASGWRRFATRGREYPSHMFVGWDALVGSA